MTTTRGREGGAVDLSCNKSVFKTLVCLWIICNIPPADPKNVSMSCKLQVAEPLLPYALAFAAGAMIYVVVDDIIPEAQTRFDISVIFTAVFTYHVYLFFDLIINFVNIICVKSQMLIY